MYSNDSYIAENWNNQYERSEDIKTHTCVDCQGTGKEYFSSCCGAEIFDTFGGTFCADCKEICEIDSRNCTVCHGEGEVSA